MNLLGYQKNDTIVISDFHLGSKKSDPSKLCHFLSELLKDPPKRVVINGDVFEFWSQSYKDIGQIEHKVVKLVMELMEEGTKVVYIPGNHDRAFRAFFKITFGKFKLRDEYIIRNDHKKYLVMHGDEFDAFTRNHAIVSLLIDQIYVFLIKLNFWMKKYLHSKKSLASLKHSKKYAETVERIRNLAMTYAKSRRVDGIIIGHSHWPEIVTAPHGITYVNSGDWIESFSYVVVGEEIKLQYYKK